MIIFQQYKLSSKSYDSSYFIFVSINRMYTGNIRGKYRPRDNIQMAGHMDLKTVTQETVKQV